VKIDSPTFLTETTFISASVQFSSGSQKFGNTTDDLHQFTGSQSTTGTGSFGKVKSDLYKVGNDNFFIGQTGGAPISDGNLILGSLNTGKQVGFEIHHSSNPVSLRLKYDGGGSELSIDNVHQNMVNNFLFKKGGTEYWRIGTGLNTTSDVANNAFLKMANSSYDYMILDDGDDTMFYIDTSTNNVGIGDFTRNRVPGAKLTVDGNISGSSTSTGSFANLAVLDSPLPTKMGSNAINISTDGVTSRNNLAISIQGNGKIGMNMHEDGGFRSAVYFDHATDDALRFELGGGHSFVMPRLTNEFSGSASSTGSFGHGRFISTAASDAVSGVLNVEHKGTNQAQTGLLIKNTQGSSNSSARLLFQGNAGDYGTIGAIASRNTNASYDDVDYARIEFALPGTSMTTHGIEFYTGDGGAATKKFEIHGNKISGSSTSTGSFGRAIVNTNESWKWCRDKKYIC